MRCARRSPRKSERFAVSYENKSPTRWKGYMITWPVASRTEPTVLLVVFVTRSVVYSACSEAHPGITKRAPATIRIGKIRLSLDICKISSGTGDLSEQRPCPIRSGFAIEDEQRDLVGELGI